MTSFGPEIKNIGAATAGRERESIKGDFCCSIALNIFKIIE
jgi:hypothetical protein